MWRRLANAGACTLAAGSIGAALVWLVSRVLGDPGVLTQFVYWAPTWAFVLAGLGCAGASWGLAMLGRPAETEPDVYANPTLRRPAFRGLRRAGMLVAAALLAFMLLSEWRVANAILGPSPAPHDRSLRVVNWNPTSTFMEVFPEIITKAEGDIAFIANPPAIVDWTLVREQFAPLKDAARQSRFAILSRYPIKRWGFTDLKVQGAEPVVQRWNNATWTTVDTGQAMWIQLDTTAVLGRELVVWFIDMPSDPRVSRNRAFREAIATIAAWRGPAMERSSPDAEAPMTPEAFAAMFGGDGFPAPDLVLGDFNTPRGSPSIKALVPGDMRGAFAQAGYGPMGTWPRNGGLLAIDQAFTAPWLGVHRYDVADPSTGEHRIQIFEIAPR